MEVDQAISAALIISPFVIGAVELAKRAGVSDRLAPIASIVFGLIFAFLVAASNTVGEVDWHHNGELYRTVLTGLAAGMIASGVYSGYQAIQRDPV